ncbi:chitobiase/beta-hexosaminidase C-terminal domain-containing protein, partial [Singulisphaera rosea]
MPRDVRTCVPLVLSLLVTSAVLAEAPKGLPSKALELELRHRDPATGEPRVESLAVDPAKVGVVVVDVWNWHWCKTATERVGALVPRMNRVLDSARELGMSVMLCPTDVVDNYVGWPQREIIFALPKHPLPPLASIVCPPPPDGGGCACGRERCRNNFGWDGMHPDLKVSATDLMPDTFEEVYSICKERGLTHLIYMGVHTQVCLLGKPMGLRNLKSAGLSCILARDLTDAHPGYDPARGFTPDGHTADVVAHFERHLAPTIDFAETLKTRGLWDDSLVLDPVRIAPWGTPMRPHLFDDEVVVTLSVPREPGASIHYTVDGTPPTSSSPHYERPLTLRDSTTLRTLAFESGRPVCLESV